MIFKEWFTFALWYGCHLEENFSQNFHSKEAEIGSEYDEVSETRSHVTWSVESEEEERIMFDSVYCSSLRGVLLEEWKKDSLVSHLSEFIFRV